MKPKLTILSIVMLLSVIVSCKDDDPIPAEASLEFSSEQIVDGTYRGVIGASDHKGKLTIALQGSVPAGIKSFEVVREYTNEVGLQSSAIAAFDELTDENEFNVEVEYTVHTSDLEASTILKAVIVDNRDRETTFELAEVEAYWPLHYAAGLYLSSDVEPGSNEAYNYYLTLMKIGNELNGAPKIDPKGAPIASFAGNNQYHAVHLIFDYDLTPKGGSPVGAYLCSPNHASTSNPALVQNFTVKNATTIKSVTYNSLTSAQATQLQKLGANDVAFLISLFDSSQASETPERVTFNGVQDDVAFVLFKTNEGKVGLIKNHDIFVGSGAEMEFNLWMMR